MKQRQKQYLEAMGIQLWERRPPATVAAPLPAADTEVQEDVVPVESPADGDGAIAGLDWQALEQRVSVCTRCDELVANRTQTVFGVGDHNADWLVIGEAPGAEEDRRGEPFVGRAGQLLNNMLRAIGLQREQVFIANILKCRPPGNRDPRPEEAANCRPYLERQIALVRPRIILVVGRIAAQNLLETKEAIGRLRGRVHRYGKEGPPVVVTYHPAYLLRAPGEKRKAWDDLRLALKVCREGSP